MSPTLELQATVKPFEGIGLIRSEARSGGGPPAGASTMYVISLDSGVGIHLKSRRHRIAHSTQRGPALPAEGRAAWGDRTMADIQKVASGIPGLDDLIEGGFWPKSTVVILGSSGTGKSTFAIQFLMEGIEQGEQALYVTLEEPPEQIMHEADLMGFDMRKYYEKSLFFIHLKGRNFKKMIEEQLPQLVKARADYNIKTRGVHHGEGVYPYLFARGVGIVVRSSPTQIPEEQSRSHVKTFDEAIKTAEAMKAPARVIERIRKMQKHWDYDYSPEEALQILFSSYGLKRGG